MTEGRTEGGNNRITPEGRNNGITEGWKDRSDLIVPLNSVSRHNKTSPIGEECIELHNPLFELINTLFSNSDSVEDFLLLLSNFMPNFSSIQAAVLGINCDGWTEVRKYGSTKVRNGVI